MTPTVEYDLSREATITATAGDFNTAIAGTPVIVGHDGSEEPKITRNLWQRPGIVAVRAVVDGRTFIILLSAHAADTEGRAIAFAEAALKSGGVI